VTGPVPEAVQQMFTRIVGRYDLMNRLMTAGRDRVWRALAGVPVGQTISYCEMARRAGEPGAAQAAGTALNRNPIALVLACQRVVGADGALVGFGGGLERKSWLLRHEGALLI